MNTYPSPQTLLPYGPTALLVDAISAFDQQTITVTRTIRNDEHYGPGLSLEGVIELCAQSAACYNALVTPDTATTKKTGVLAGAEGFGLTRAIAAGETLYATAKKTFCMGSLAQYHCILSDDSGKQLSAGTITVGTA